MDPRRSLVPIGPFRPERRAGVVMVGSAPVKLRYADLEQWLIVGKHA